MYEGDSLFGDLPSAKAQSSKEKKGNIDNEESSKKRSNPLFLHADTSSASDVKDSNRFFQHPTTKSKAKVKSSVSLVGSIGNAGTTMAFVPASLRKRNRTIISNSGSSISSAIAGNTISSSSTSKKKTTEITNFEPNEIVGNKNSIKARNKVDMNECSNKMEAKEQMNTENDKDDPKLKNVYTASDSESAQVIMTESKPIQESEEMRLLHASVSDADRYDPLIPNDLLAYRERKKNQRRLDQLEKSARETLRLQQIMREKIEEERKKVEATGDYQKIAENRLKTSAAMGDGDDTNQISRIERSQRNGVIGVNSDFVGASMGRGRGRGRGVSNLPAWLIKKQQEEKASENVVLDRESQAKPCSPPTSTLVLLSNMTAPGDIDDYLSEEVKEECEMQCGPVEFVKIFDVDQNHREVRVFVKFSKSSHAENASKLFHGRKFAQRIISALLVDETEIR